MNARHDVTFALVLAVSCGASLRAQTDRLVDPAGAPGTYLTIQAAIDAAVSGDRILVAPGAYPAIAVTKPIAILGMGASPNDVGVGGIAFASGGLGQNYRVAISRLRVDAGPLSPLAVSGQELGTGQIEFESVTVQGGFRLLGGASGFVMELANCSIAGDIGQGFDGATCHIAAPAPSNFAISRCTFHGAAGDLFAAQSPMAGLLVDRGVTVSIAQCTVQGGAGGIAQPGAAGLVVRNGQVRALGTGSVVRGGDGGPGAAGGAGVSTTSNVFRGTATVLGGSGSPNGPVSSGVGALLGAGIDPELEVLVDGATRGPVAAGAGTHLQWHNEAFGSPSLVLFSFALVAPYPAPFDRLTIDLTNVGIVGNDLDVVLPAHGVIGLTLFGQGVALDVAHGTILASAPFAVRLEP